MTLRIGFIPIRCDTCHLNREEDEELDEWLLIHSYHAGHLHYENCSCLTVSTHKQEAEE